MNSNSNLFIQIFNGYFIIVFGKNCVNIKKTIVVLFCFLYLFCHVLFVFFFHLLQLIMIEDALLVDDLATLEVKMRLNTKEKRFPFPYTHTLLPTRMSLYVWKQGKYWSKRMLWRKNVSIGLIKCVIMVYTIKLPLSSQSYESHEKNEQKALRKEKKTTWEHRNVIIFDYSQTIYLLKSVCQWNKTHTHTFRVTYAFWGRTNQSTLFTIFPFEKYLHLMHDFRKHWQMCDTIDQVTSLLFSENIAL